MKFGQTLGTRLTPEWRKQYINYNYLKNKILKTFERASLRTEPLQADYLQAFDEDFFQECIHELTKIETFFAEKKAEAKRKFSEYQLELQLLAGSRIDKTKLGIDVKRTHRQMKLALSEYYLSLILLRNYQTLNCTGFRKILKKYDKRIDSNRGDAFYTTRVQTSDVYLNTEIDSLISETENLFSHYLENGNKSRAMKHLRVPPFEEAKSTWGTFRLGYVLGIWSCLLCILLVSVSLYPVSPAEEEHCVQAHEATLLIIVFLFLIGINIYGWQKCGVNHVLIFEIDPRDHLSATDLLEIASYFGVLWTLSFLTCLHEFPSFLPSNVCALIVCIAMLVYWLNPAHIFHYRARVWLMKIIIRILGAPFFKVNFADFWLADQLCSLTKPLIDFPSVLCLFFIKDWPSSTNGFLCPKDVYQVTTPILYCLPSWWRILQSLRRYSETRQKYPFLVNCAKYTTTFPVAIFTAVVASNREHYRRLTENPYFWCLIISRIVNSTFTYTWDIIRDFGLLRKFSGENIFLRNEIIYSPSFYYFAIIEDFFLRFLWALIYFIDAYSWMNPKYVSTLGFLAEIFRRHIWNYIRLENEHLTNVGQFRAVRDISIGLAIPDDKKMLLEMMDNKGDEKSDEELNEVDKRKEKENEEKD